MNTFTDFKLKSSSEKITLATVNASKRLMGWSLVSGSVYSLPNFTLPIIVQLTQNGVGLTQVGIVSALAAGTFCIDRDSNTLYCWLADSTHPNASFMAMITTLFYSTAPVTLPWDLNTGFQVYWEPEIKGTSQFGVEIDVVNQVSEAIEGTGSLTLNNNQSFWKVNYDKLFFDNQRCQIYSYNRDLPASEAKLLFDGLILSKAFSPTDITFQLNDLITQLRTPLPLETIGALTAQTPLDVQNMYQRMIFGRVDGHRPVNIDQELANTGYPLEGTISINNSDVNVVGVGTSFISKLSPGDGIYLTGVKYTVAAITSNTALTVTQPLSTANIVGDPLYIAAATPKRYVNRVWKVAGHALRQPTVTVSGTSTIQRLVVSSTKDLLPGDEIYIGTVGSGEVATVASVLGFHTIVLTGSLATIPPVGTVVTRPCIQNVRLNGLKLVYYNDFTFDASTATLTLRSNAEANRAPLLELGAQLSFTSGSPIVTVTTAGASIQGVIAPGYMLGINESYFEVLSVDSPTQATLRTPWPVTATGAGQYKSYTFDPANDVLTCSCLGRTDDATPTGNLLGTGPSIIKALLTDMGLLDSVNTASFDETEELAYQQLGLVIPAGYSDKTLPTYTAVINQVNTSILGTLIQDENFKLKHTILRPQKTPTTSTYFTEADVLTLQVDTTNVNSVRDVYVTYASREYDYLVSGNSIQTATKDSEIAQYLLNTTRTKTIPSLLYLPKDALVYANRWSFLLENATSIISITTKLQAIDLEVNSIVDINHRKLYERLGGTGTRKICAIQKIVKSGTDVLIEAVDLGNCFNRTAAINDLPSSYADTSEDNRIYGGFYTDAYGMQANDPDTFGSNLIW